MLIDIVREACSVLDQFSLVLTLIMYKDYQSGRGREMLFRSVCCLY